MDRDDKTLDGAGLGDVWAKVKAQVSVLASGLGQVLAMAQDNSIAIGLHGDRLSDLESYFDGSSAKSALKLATARKINGTDFNGTADITTSYWGTARNIQIKDADGTNEGTAVSVNGSQAYKIPLPTNIKLASLLATQGVTSQKSIEAYWGVSAGGMATLSMQAVGSYTEAQLMSLNVNESTSYITANTFTLSGDKRPQYQIRYTSRTTLTLAYPSTEAVGVVHHLFLYNDSGSALTVSFPDNTYRPSTTLSIPSGKAVDIEYMDTGIQGVGGTIHIVKWSSAME